MAKLVEAVVGAREQHDGPDVERQEGRGDPRRDVEFSQTRRDRTAHGAERRARIPSERAVAIDFFGRERDAQSRDGRIERRGAGHGPVRAHG